MDSGRPPRWYPNLTVWTDTDPGIGHQQGHIQLKRLPPHGEAVQYRLSRIMSVRVTGQVQNLVLSISSSVILSPVRSYSLVVCEDS